MLDNTLPRWYNGTHEETPHLEKWFYRLVCLGIL